MKTTTSSSLSGFTIVELMVTLAVAAILMGFALPAFNAFVDQRRMASRANDFLLAVTYARSEAARRGERVSLVSLGADTDNEWGDGYTVEVDSDNETLRSYAPLDDASFDAAGVGWDGIFRLTFTARGLLTPQPGVPGDIELCHDDADVDPGRVVNISVTGRPDLEELTCNP